jgi:hypothetical protein
MKQIYKLSNNIARRLAIESVRQAPTGFIVEVKPPTRSLEQNSRLWSMLSDVSNHVIWHGRKLDSESWKHIFTSSLKRMDIVPNLEGTGFVALGMSTSRMTKKELGDLMELISAFGAENGVKFTEQEIEPPDRY